MAIELLTDKDGKLPAEKDYQWFSEQFEKSYIDLKQKPKRPDGIISIGKETGFDGNEYPKHIFTKGGFSVISAPSKTFKSTFKSQLASVYYTGQSDEFSEMRGHRKNNETVVDIDTEQEEYYAWNTFHRTKRLCGNADLSNFYFPFKLRHLSSEERIEFIDMALESKKLKVPALMFIDGIADLMDDSNDLPKSNAIVEKVMKWTDYYNIHICCIIHNTYGTKKAVGHLGSAVTKKAQTVINISKYEENSDIYKVSHEYSRGAKFDDFYFMHDWKRKVLYQVNEPDAPEETDGLKW